MMAAAELPQVDEKVLVDVGYGNQPGTVQSVEDADHIRVTTQTGVYIVTHDDIQRLQDGGDA